MKSYCPLKKRKSGKNFCLSMNLKYWTLFINKEITKSLMKMKSRETVRYWNNRTKISFKPSHNFGRQFTTMGSKLWRTILLLLLAYSFGFFIFIKPQKRIPNTPSLPMTRDKQRKDILLIWYYILNRDKTFKFEIEKEIVKILVR